MEIPTTWNPWHGCRKCSEGCDHCYMFAQDRSRGLDGGKIYQSKTNFLLPLKKDRRGCWKIPGGATLRVCMTSDFFLEDADPWRDRAWGIIRFRSDVQFLLLTKRIHRVADCLPRDWGNGWDNVAISVSAENQRRADERIPILLDLPAKKKGIMVAPFLGPVDLSAYLAAGQIGQVIADGESGDHARPLYDDWIRALHGQCVRYDVPLDFIGTGSVFVKDGRTYHIPRDRQHDQALRSGYAVAGTFTLSTGESEAREGCLSSPESGSAARGCLRSPGSDSVGTTPELP